MAIALSTNSTFMNYHDTPELTLLSKSLTGAHTGIVVTQVNRLWNDLARNDTVLLYLCTVGAQECRVVKVFSKVNEVGW
jgi:hypothetical protein